ncbi:General alpha-glucoside permease [Colletotrichum orbiculare MAFF 240422]|uniref:General alpha-glucoside permease n=1 Tax=Colletotrichum orbiculare (strain 104-T / ATCC 96160 / CBS 514.97 / LARS 414 / MAFF 240422) TaxID=1213857 RepID=A0A484FKZ0_COLOR|nr:General alpha-glucoside permease [Colletotrichum orbiculare MAFF 240422]
MSRSGAQYSLLGVSYTEDADLPTLDEDYRESHEGEPLSLPRLLLLTCPSLGLQVFWFLLTSRGTPYLHSLDIPKSIVSLTWVTGPLFGAYAQPILGVLSDESWSRLGKRKTFMACGALGAVTAQLALASVRDLTSAGGDDNTTGGPAGLATQMLAVACVVATTFSLQAYAVGVRALIVDSCPASQQFSAAAWAMRWNVLGNIVLSAVGVFLSQQPLSGNDASSRFGMLAVVSALCSLATVGLTCLFISEKQTELTKGRSEPLTDLLWSIISPNRLRIQLFAWAGWFPVLYYMSTYAYETALSSRARDTPETQGVSRPDLTTDQDAMQYSYLATLAFAFGAAVSSIALSVLEQAKLSSATHLQRIWLASQCLLGYCMQLTWVAQTGAAAAAVVAVMGMTGPVTMWVPFALVSADIAEVSAGTPEREVAWILGLHNMAISLPQIGSTLVCAVLLALCKALDVTNSVAWVFRLASIPVFYSAWLIFKLK